MRAPGDSLSELPELLDMIGGKCYKSYEGARMKSPVLLFAAASVAVLLAQTAATQSVTSSSPANSETSLEDRLRSLPKRFPPELLATPASTAPAGTSHSYCVYTVRETNSIRLERCQAPPGLQLIAPFKTAKPGNKPNR